MLTIVIGLVLVVGAYLPHLNSDEHNLKTLCRLALLGGGVGGAVVLAGVVKSAMGV